MAAGGFDAPPAQIARLADDLDLIVKDTDTVARGLDQQGARGAHASPTEDVRQALDLVSDWLRDRTSSNAVALRQLAATIRAAGAGYAQTDRFAADSISPPR